MRFIIADGKYKVGNTKTVKKFAFFPTKINSMTMVWLEQYFVTYQLRKNRYYDESGVCIELYWQEIERWIENE